MATVKKKKFVIKYKVTNKNIHLRFKSEQEKYPDFTLNKLAAFFGLFTHKKDKDGNYIPDRTLVYRWTSLNPRTQRQPNNIKKCPKCNKTMYQFVEEWINDGSLN